MNFSQKNKETDIQLIKVAVGHLSKKRKEEKKKEYNHRGFEFVGEQFGHFIFKAEIPKSNKLFGVLRPYISNDHRE